MFRFRQPSHPARSPARAVLLRGSTLRMFNHLCRMGPGTLVLRQQGLSLAKSTCFGQCVACPESGWHLLREQAGGLEVDLQRRQQVYLVTDPGDRRPLLAIAEPGREIECFVRLEGHVWESPAIQEMIGLFEGEPVDACESWRLGAGAWLDDWKGDPPSAAGGDFLPHAIAALKACGFLEVEIQTSAQRTVTGFQPSFIDSERSILRIADKSRGHVVFADVAAPEFRLIRLSPSCLRICRQTGGSTRSKATSFPAA